MTATKNNVPPNSTLLMTVLVLRTSPSRLAAERQAHAEARRIIAGLVERIPALEPTREDAPESTVSTGPRCPYRGPRRPTDGHTATSEPMVAPAVNRPLTPLGAIHPHESPNLCLCG